MHAGHVVACRFFFFVILVFELFELGQKVVKRVRRRGKTQVVANINEGHKWNATRRCGRRAAM